MTSNLRTAAVLIAIAASACGGGGSDSSAPDPVRAPSEVALQQVADCDELLTAIRADARAKIQVQARELREHGWSSVGGGGGSPIWAFTPTPVPAALPTPAAGAPSRDATDTNTQVPGVDEADVVETDGDRLYVLRDDELVIVHAFPPEELAGEERVAIEGWPLGMFVADGRALVLSQVSDPGDLGGDPQCLSIGAPFPAAPWTTVPFVPPCQSTFVKLTLLDLTASPARLVRELYIEGSYVSARRHEARARVVAQRIWGVPARVADPWSTLWSPTRPTSESELVARIDRWEQTALAAIDASTLADWLPTQRERIGGALVEHPLTCAHTHVPPAGASRQGTTLIVGVDLAGDDTPPADTVLLGQASQTYANDDTLVLAFPDWQAAPFENATSRTALHVFDLPSDSLATAYRGSGFVPGTVLSQFAIDARADVLRVATSFVDAASSLNVTRVTTARIEDGALATVGASPDLAPGEQLFAARFVGERAYLVTFRRIDPLFVIDLADPAHPTVAGEVELPGFSEYLHPLDDDHLLTIGRAADLDGRTLGAALRIFDVGDPSAPRLAHEYVLPETSWTPAETNHLAFTFEPRLGVLALPVQDYSAGFSPTLHLIAADAAAGFTLRGVIEHALTSVICAPPFDWESCPVSAEMQRGLFIDDFVYSLSTARIEVHALDALDDEIESVSLR